MKLDEKLKQAFMETLKNDPASKSRIEDWIDKNKRGQKSEEVKKSLNELRQETPKTDTPPKTPDASTTPDASKKPNAEARRSGGEGG